MMRGWLRIPRLVLDIGLQPAELDDGNDDRHHEQHDCLRAGEAVASELERRAVDQLDDGDRGVVGSTAVGHDVDAFENLTGADGVDDHQVQRGRPEQGYGDVAPPGVPTGALDVGGFVQLFGDAADGGWGQPHATP